MTKYFCRKWQRYLTKREIFQDHDGRCFRVSKGRRKGRPCSSLVILD